LPKGPQMYCWLVGNPASKSFALQGHNTVIGKRGVYIEMPYRCLEMKAA
jgi:hypothetical protein